MQHRAHIWEGGQIDKVVKYQCQGTNESTADFKERLKSKLPREARENDRKLRPCVRTPSDRGYYPPTRTRACDERAQSEPKRIGKLDDLGSAIYRLESVLSATQVSTLKREIRDAIKNLHVVRAERARSETVATSGENALQSDVRRARQVGWWWLRPRPDADQRAQSDHDLCQSAINSVVAMMREQWPNAADFNVLSDEEVQILDSEDNQIAVINSTTMDAYYEAIEQSGGGQ